MVFWKYPVSLPVEVGCGVSQGKVSFRSAAFRASRTMRDLIKEKEIAGAFKVGVECKGSGSCSSNNLSSATSFAAPPSRWDRGKQDDGGSF